MITNFVNVANMFTCEKMITEVITDKKRSMRSASSNKRCISLDLKLQVASSEWWAFILYRCTPQKRRKRKIEPAEIWRSRAHDSDKCWRYCGEARTGGLRESACAAGGRRRVRRQAAGPVHGRVRNGCAQWPACVRRSTRSSCCGHRRWVRSYQGRSQTFDRGGGKGGAIENYLNLRNICKNIRKFLIKFSK